MYIVYMYTQICTNLHTHTHTHTHTNAHTCTYIVCRIRGITMFLYWGYRLHKVSFSWPKKEADPAPSKGRNLRKFDVKICMKFMNYLSFVNVL